MALKNEDSSEMTDEEERVIKERLESLEDEESHKSTSEVFEDLGWGDAL